MDIEFVSDISQINKEIKKEYRSVNNRLQSILLDSRLVVRAVNAYNLPLVPNERCGSWYAPPYLYTQTCYFKSTDGHINNWDFSTRRLNLQLLPIIAENNGIIIIDSTRRGKIMPDSLSKTIPIWCAVLNAIRTDDPIGSVLSPADAVAKSEHIRISERLPSLIKKAKQLNVITKESLQSHFSKPLKPVWITPRSKLPESAPNYQNLPYIPVYLVTTSFQCQDGTDKRDGYIYVQGAADDHELWSEGLTPKLLWENLSFFEIKHHSETEILDHIHNLTVPQAPESSQLYRNLVQITPQLGKAVLASSNLSTKIPSHIADIIVVFAENFIPPESKVPKILHYKLSSGSKKSGKQLRTELPKMVPELCSALFSGKSVILCCETGGDISVGVVLCLLCLCYQYPSDGGLREGIAERREIDKIVIRKQLIDVIGVDSGVNPSRAVLNSVNSYLMSS